MKELRDKYKQWCEETKRNGSVLVGGSVYEFFDWMDESSTSVDELKEYIKFILFTNDCDIEPMHYCFTNEDIERICTSIASFHVNKSRRFIEDIETKLIKSMQQVNDLQLRNEQLNRYLATGYNEAIIGSRAINFGKWISGLNSNRVEFWYKKFIKESGIK